MNICTCTWHTHRQVYVYILYLKVGQSGRGFMNACVGPPERAADKTNSRGEGVSHGCLCSQCISLCNKSQVPTDGGDIRAADIPNETDYDWLRFNRLHILLRLRWITSGISWENDREEFIIKSLIFYCYIYSLDFYSPLLFGNNFAEQGLIWF